MELSDALKGANLIIKSKVDPLGQSLLDGTYTPVVDPILGTFFDINHPNATQSSKLNDVYEYLKQNGGNSELEMVSILKDIRFRIGTPPVGKSLLDKVHTYAKLRLQAKSLENQAKAMEA